uniref:Uncharacterized protein n=1 Tax=Caudovirales sp. ctNZz8 TaxID=2826772 RepID=A0A8S5QZ89_9CAUD|nr:MAG TPA: hypothetical protein [Caudovirales sp. ctNZz8]
MVYGSVSNALSWQNKTQLPYITGFPFHCAIFANGSPRITR